MNNFREFDLEKSETGGNMLIEASAGTGKTYSLEQLVLKYILEKRYSIKEILAVTFTEKATNELKVRIRAALKNKIEESSLSESAEELKILKKAYLEFSDISIYTLHGFCKFCLTNYPFESGVSFSNKIIESDELYHEAVMDYLRSIDPENLGEEYLCFRNNIKDIEAAPAFFTALLKNSRIFESFRIIPDEKSVSDFKKLNKEYRSGKGTLFQAVKSICSCNSGYEEFETISKTLKLGQREAAFSALADFAEYLKKAETAFDIFSEKLSENTKRLSKYTLSHIQSKNKDVSILDADSIALVNAVSCFMEAAGKYADPGDSEKYLYCNIGSWCFISGSLEKIRKNTGNAKLTRSLLDFEDLISLTKNALALSGSSTGARDGSGTFKGVTPSRLAVELKRRYKVVLVDEFQDTDSYQWDILSLIFADRNHEIILIGDPKQSIYRFRGADIEVYFKAAASLENIKRCRLGTSYRSLKPVVEGINRIFSSVFRFKTGGGHKVDYHDLKSCEKLPVSDNGKPADYTIKPGIELLGIPADNGSFTNKGKIFSAVENLFCSEILKLIESGVPPGDISILMEANSECVSMYNALKQSNIPSVFEGDIDLFSTSEIYQFVDFLYALALPGDIPRIKKALFTDFFNFTLDEIYKLSENRGIDRVTSLFALWNEKISRGKLFEVMEIILKHKNPVRIFLDDNDVEKSQPLLVRKLKESGGERSITNILHITEILTSRNSAGKENASALLRYIISVIEGAEKEDEKLIRLDRDSKCVRIMTIHKSKGLEFPIVFFGGGYNDPGSSRINYYEYIENNIRYADFSKNSLNLEKHKNELWEEKKRLYYVAFTRTVKKLYLPVFEECGFYTITDIYASMVYDQLEKILSDEEIPFAVPLYQAAEEIRHKGMKITEVKSIISSHIYNLLKKDYSDGEVFTFTEKNLSDSDNPENALFLSQTKAENRKEKPALKKELTDFSGKKKIPLICSYTSIIKTGSSSNLIRQIEIKEPEPEEDAVIQDSDLRHIKGADFGNIMHAMLEEADYNEILSMENAEKAFENPKIKELAVMSARKYVSSEKAEKCVRPAVDLLYQTITSSLNVDGSFIKTGEISPDNRRHEVEFILKIRKGKSEKLMGLEKLELENGYLKGYIDMIFRHNNLIYIADWKTNYLGSSLSDYSPEKLEKAMTDSGYLLQMNLYMTALDLMLQNRKDLSPGGCFYLFLRGLSPGGGSGIYFSKPLQQQIEKFKKTFIDMEYSIVS